MTGTRRGPDPMPCGTRAAYRRHRDSGERPCDPCKAAQAEYNAKRKHQRAPQPCPGCGVRTRALKLCPDCTYDTEIGLIGGDWVVIRGIKVWVPWERRRAAA